jgi:hypothetical protein
MHNVHHRTKKSINVGYFYKFKKTTQRKHSLFGRKFAQSGHPDADPQVSMSMCRSQTFRCVCLCCKTNVSVERGPHITDHSFIQVEVISLVQKFFMQSTAHRYLQVNKALLVRIVWIKFSKGFFSFLQSSPQTNDFFCYIVLVKDCIHFNTCSAVKKDF